MRRSSSSSKEQLRINGEIRAREVRVIDQKGEQLGVLTVAQAQEIADNSGLDLVEVVPVAQPPVCRLMDYGKYKFEQSKKAATARKNQKLVKVKEIKFRPGTEEGDYQVKLSKLKKFLEAGDKVKVTLRFRGREIAHHELGAELLSRIEKDLIEEGVVEQFPKMEGRQMIMVAAPLKKKV